MQEQSPQEIIVDLCKQFYNQGWVSGTGGGISIRTADNIYIAPSGVHKERMSPTEIYVLDKIGDKILYDPNNNKHEAIKGPYKISECRSLFMAAYKFRNAGAVIHSHSINAMLVTILCSGQSEFRCSHLEMIKGISGHGYHSELIVPIIENKAREHELCDEMESIIRNSPSNCHAVLVRRHGVYVWGKDWIECKTHAEVYDYLFAAFVELHKLGLKEEVLPKVCKKCNDEGNNNNK